MITDICLLHMLFLCLKLAVLLYFIMPEVLMSLKFVWFTVSVDLIKPEKKVGKLKECIEIICASNVYCKAQQILDGMKVASSEEEFVFFGR